MAAEAEGEVSVQLVEEVFRLGPGNPEARKIVVELPSSRPESGHTLYGMEGFLAKQIQT